MHIPLHETVNRFDRFGKRRMTDGYFHYFEERTRGYAFNSKEAHFKRVQELLTQVRKMAIKKYFQTPKRMETVFPKEDWIQTAMITLFECCESYDGRQPFDHYARFMVSRRLTDRQRELYRKNPTELEGDKERTAPSHIEAEAYDRAEPSGHCRRPVTEVLMDQHPPKDASDASSPETAYMMEESRRTLLDCIEKLDNEARVLFVCHEMEEDSFQVLFDRFHIGKEMAFSSFKRWYKDQVFESVKNCVTNRLAVKEKARGQ